MTFKSTLPMIGLAVVFLVLTALLRVAETSGLLDGDTGTRSFMVFTGLMVMVFGNVVPKQLKRPGRRRRPSSASKTRCDRWAGP